MGVKAGIDSGLTSNFNGIVLRSSFSSLSFPLSFAFLSEEGLAEADDDVEVVEVGAEFSAVAEDSTADASPTLASSAGWLLDSECSPLPLKNSLIFP